MKVQMTLVELLKISGIRNVLSEEEFDEMIQIVEEGLPPEKNDLITVDDSSSLNLSWENWKKEDEKK